MLALRLDDTVSVVEAPLPERASGEALLRMRIAGICDTDLVEAEYPLGDAALALEHASRQGTLKILVTAQEGA
jgi:D-arabinose 1-dehydrogenase-like Zn-dependent alcohol dehydrogenase